MQPINDIGYVSLGQKAEILLRRLDFDKDHPAQGWTMKTKYQYDEAENGIASSIRLINFQSTSKMAELAAEKAG